MSVPLSLPLLNIKNNNPNYLYATAGFVQLGGGQAVVSNVYARLDAKIFLSYYALGNPGRLFIASVAPGFNTFTIASTNPNDISVVCWFIVVENSSVISPDTYGYPVFANSGSDQTYGIATLNNGRAFIPCSFINQFAPILLSVQTPSSADDTPYYFIQDITAGIGFNIYSTVANDDAQIGYWVLYPSYLDRVNTDLTVLTVDYPFLDSNAASKSYGKSQFSVGGLPVEIPTTRAAFDVIVFSSIMQTNVNRQNISLPYLFGVNEGSSIFIQTIDSFFNDTSFFSWMMLLNTQSS